MVYLQRFFCFNPEITRLCIGLKMDSLWNSGGPWPGCFFLICEREPPKCYVASRKMNYYAYFVHEKFWPPSILPGHPSGMAGTPTYRCF